MAQAEHDPLATCYLVTFSADYADAVEAAIDEHMKQSTRAEITTASLVDQGLIVVCTDLPQALEAVNVIAPEHLELHIANPMDSLGAIRHAGAIFLGEWTPEAVGDYVAGPNHTLPTGGTARFSSPLAVEQFIKKSSIIQYSPAALWPMTPGHRGHRPARGAVGAMPAASSCAWSQLKPGGKRQRFESCALRWE